MAGLYSKKNLGEVQLNLKDALQKLYAPGIQEDVRLFAFSNALYSEISSATLQIDSTSGEETEISNQIYGLVNQPFTDNDGQIYNRTKFVTNKLTFSSNNDIFFQEISTSGFTLDRRTDTSEGASIIISKNGSVVNVEVLGTGSQYEIRNQSGSVLTGVNSVKVNVRGEESGAENAVVELTIDPDGSLSKTVVPIVISGGSGYLENEDLEIITQCDTNRFGQEEKPSITKCKNYSASENRLYHKEFKYTIPEEGEDIDYDTVTLGYTAKLGQLKYTYKTKDAGEEGFFLYDERAQKWVYLGDFYDAIYKIEPQISASLVLRRFDKVTSLNLLNLTDLNATSYFFSYEEGYKVQNNLASAVRELTKNAETIRDSFKYLLQNNKKQRLITDEENTLGTQYNIFEGKNFDSTFRLIMRDPDGILDKSEVDFVTLRTLEQPDQVELTVGDPSTTYHVPGFYINVGGVYKRAFNTDDKPFLSSKERSFISPLIDKLSDPNAPYTAGVFTPRAASGENKYSISTAYLKPGGETVVGFNTNIGTLVQNLSSVAGNGGFVFHRALSTPTINLSQSIQGWPIFSYEYNGVIYSPHILAHT